ncbi:MAG TPA: hypothetical protein VKK06_17725 [Terriglobia bacterium]|nr:hypothetical protein [Terriglobia bacterium]
MNTSEVDHRPVVGVGCASLARSAATPGSKLARASQKLAAIVGSEDVHGTANYVSG